MHVLTLSWSDAAQYLSARPAGSRTTTLLLTCCQWVIQLANDLTPRVNDQRMAPALPFLIVSPSLHAKANPEGCCAVCTSGKTTTIVFCDACPCISGATRAAADAGMEVSGVPHTCAAATTYAWHSIARARSSTSQ